MFEKYVKILKDNALKVTSQRLEIMNYLDTHKTHPTADEIFSALKKMNPSLSRTTVYNSLEVLKKQGIIQTLTITGSQYRYDFETNMHHHFLCRQCKKIIDIDIECPNIDKVIQGGHKVEEVHGYFKGICRDCRSSRGGS